MADVRALIVGPHKHDVADLCSRDGERSRDACKAYGLRLLQEHRAPLRQVDLDAGPRLNLGAADGRFPHGAVRARDDEIAAGSKYVAVDRTGIDPKRTRRHEAAGSCFS